MNNVHFAIPEIYGETLSYYELLRKIVTKMNELIGNYNTVPDQIAEEVKKLDAYSVFTTAMNWVIHSIATDNTKSKDAVRQYKKHDLLYATFNDTVNLYEAITDFTNVFLTELKVGENIREVNISELFIELRKLIDVNKNNIESVTAVANENSAEIATMNNDITDIENKNTEQDNEISTLRTMLSTPYNFKGDVASISALPASGAVNDTYYVQEVKYKVTWTGSAWVQSSLNEADYQTELRELKGDLVNQTKYSALLENEYCETLGIHNCIVNNGNISATITDATKLDFLMLPNVKELTFKIPNGSSRFIVISTKLDENKYYCLNLAGYGFVGNLDSIASWTPDRQRAGYKVNPLSSFRPSEDGFYKIILVGNDIKVYFSNEIIATINEANLEKSLGFMINDSIVVLSASAIVPLNKVVEHTNNRIDELNQDLGVERTRIDELNQDLGVERTRIDELTPPSSTEVDLVMFMGQSNMAGRGTVDEAPYCVDDIGYEFKSVSDPTKLYKVSEPFGYAENSTYINDGNAKSGSLVSAFMREYFRITNRKIVGISASQGSTTVQFWSSNQNVINDYINRFNTAKTWLENNGYTIKHKFCVFCQGESNGDAGMDATRYKTLLNDFCQYRMNRDLGMDKTFIISIGQYNGVDETLVNAYKTIQNAQKEYCETSIYAELVSTMFKGMKDRDLMKDLYHYKQQGYNEVGAEAGYNVGIIMK